MKSQRSENHLWSAVYQKLMPKFVPLPQMKKRTSHEELRLQRWRFRATGKKKTRRQPSGTQQSLRNVEILHEKFQQILDGRREGGDRCIQIWSTTNLKSKKKCSKLEDRVRRVEWGGGGGG